MARIFLLLIFLLTLQSLWAQEYVFAYFDDRNPVVTNEDVVSAQLISDVMPNLWDNLTLPYQEQIELSLIHNYFPDQPYTKVFNVISYELSTFSNGVEKIIMSTDHLLTTAHKENLLAADLGSLFYICIKFRHKYTATASLDDIKIGVYTGIIMPTKQAKFPGGNEAITDYMRKAVFDKLPKAMKEYDKLPAAVNFKVSETGLIESISFKSSSESAEVERFIYNALSEMPKWNPAENSKGEKVSQQINIPFTFGC